MLLRIEDTDRERSTKAAIDAILDGPTWLGIDWDGDAIYQYSRAARHREVVEELLASGRAYRCYASQAELAEMREKARAEGRSKLYDGRWRDRDASEAPPDVKPVIRLKAPLTGEAVIEDQVQGRVAWRNENLDDLVLLRSDGRRPICWRWWSTTTTWQSPTSSEATTTSPTPPARSRSTTRSAGRCR
jgi:glutamyl-tRNA synthetase